MQPSQPQRKDWHKKPKCFILIAEQTLYEKTIPAYLSFIALHDYGICTQRYHVIGYPYIQRRKPALPAAKHARVY